MNHAELKKTCGSRADGTGPAPEHQRPDIHVRRADLEKPDRNEIRKALNELQEDYAERGVELKEVASGFRFQARSDLRTMDKPAV